MIKPTNLFVISCAVIGAYFVHHAYAVSTAPAAFSQYGQIQAVQNYSSNPFWHPGSPYNQKAIPKPIYVTGADLNTGDCNRIVENLVASFCVSNNNCTGMRLADVRPTIMVQLSQLPGHNFATSCGGYIDSIFNKYAKSGTALNLPLPTGITTGIATFQFKNPYEIKPTAEQQAVADRAAELAALQAQTGGATGVSAAAFPKTLADLSFTDRMANAATGYEPYKDKSAYAIPNFEDENSAEFLDRLQKRNPSEYCKRFPTATVDGTDCKCILNPDDTACKTAPTQKPAQKKQAPTQCTDTAHMDANCNCKAGDKAKINNKGMCECKNGGDIDNDCAITPTPDPATDGKVYALLQCRVKPKRLQNSIFIGTGKKMTKPAEALGCAGTPSSGIHDTDKCFSPCYGGTNRADGIVNKLTENIFQFCSGNQYGNSQKNRNQVVQNIYFLSTISQQGNLIPLELTNLQATNAINILKQNTDTTATSCTDSSRYWMVYLLQKTPDNQWVALDFVTIGGAQR